MADLSILRTLPLMSDDDLVISPASRSEALVLLRTVNEHEGWDPCLEAIDAWLAVDPEAFWIGRHNGTPVAYICAIRYDGYGFIGCYWVAPDQRGHRFGIRMFRHGLARLDGCNVGLSAVHEQVNNYIKSGFIDLFEDLIYYGHVAHLPVSDSARVFEYADSMLDAVAAYDRQTFPADRKELLRLMFKIEKTAVRVHIEDGTIRGYALLHDVPGGHEVSPCSAHERNRPRPRNRAGEFVARGRENEVRD
jgi:hypothetical protein